MTTQPRLITAVVLTGAAMAGLVLAQDARAPRPQSQTPTGLTPTPPAVGRGADPGQQGAGQGGGRQGGGRQGGGRRGGFTQFTRPLAPQDVIVRGKVLYETNCASCHAVDLRGTVDGKNPNLLRSGTALRDQNGELVTAAVAKHNPAITMIGADTVAIAEYIHSVHATMGGQGSPPGRNPTGIMLNVLVGDATGGEAMFATWCSSCHSVTGDLRGIAAKFTDPRALQNAWVSGSAAGGGGRGGRGGGVGAGLPATITMADGSKLEGRLVRQDDFLVVLILPDGTRRSMARTDGVPKVEVRDPRAGHVNAIVKLAHEDSLGRMMHNITAYLSTIK